jgi:hypothetical protein
MTLSSISSVIESAKLANNKRLLSMAMSPSELRCAEKAVARGLMSKHYMMMPGFGAVWAYQLP